MYNLIKYNDVYSKTSGSSRQYHRDEPALENNHNITDIPGNNNNSILFKFKLQITGQARNSGTQNVEIMVPSKYLSNFWRTLGMLLINCQISLQLKWSKDCFLVAGTAANQVLEFKITNTNLYVPGITLSTQDNLKPPKQFNNGFKRIVSWYQFQSSNCGNKILYGYDRWKKFSWSNSKS